jgi:hypothetical protein
MMQGRWGHGGGAGGGCKRKRLIDVIDVARQNSWLAAVSMYVTEQIGIGLIASVVHELTQTLVHAMHDM